MSSNGVSSQGTSLKGQSISVLGSGWLGAPLADVLSGFGAIVRVASRSKDRLEGLAERGHMPYQVDLPEYPDELDDFLRASTLIINITLKDPDGYRPLIAAIEHSMIRQLLFISSTSVYPMLNRTVSESDALAVDQHPLRQIEQSLSEISGVSTTILRFSGLIGGDRQPGRFFASDRIVSNPDTPVNLIHRQDCLGLITSIVSQGVWGDVFEGCAPSHPTKRAFYSHAARQIGLDPPRFAEGSANDPFKRIDGSAICERTGYRFIYPDLMRIDLAAEL